MPDGLQETIEDAGETKFPARKEVGKLPRGIRCDGRSKAFYVYRTELDGGRAIPRQEVDYLAGRTHGQ